jgi:hypothetical protein
MRTTLVTLAIALAPAPSANGQSFTAPTTVTPCDGLGALPLAELLERERLANYDLRQRSGSPEFWRELGCLRSAIHATGAKGREGALMISGTTWQQGAINAYLQALRVDSADAMSHTKLGQLILDDWFADSLGPVGRAILRGAAAGAADADALRACTVAAYWAKDRPTVKACATYGLARGRDSSSHYLALARVAAAEEDSMGTTNAFDFAVRTAREAADRDAVRWHLQWFLSPPEQATVDSADGAEFVRRIRDAIARRDVRDGRAPGARLVEHFHRLEYAESRFAMQRPKAERDRLRTLPAFVLIPDSVADRLRTARIRDGQQGDVYDPIPVSPKFRHSVPALPWREYPRWQVDLDDRGIVHLRYGHPDQRIPRMGVFTAREVWVYMLDGEKLLVNFESEAFTGTVEATRLVTGVLGDYLCDVDTLRCMLTDGTRPLTPESLAQLRFQDREHLTTATTKDNNAVQPAKQVRILAGAFALWRPSDRGRVTVMPYAIRAQDLERLPGDSLYVPIELRASSWDGGAGVRHDSILTRRLRVPSRAGSETYVTGTITLPGTAGLSAWSIIASQGPDRGGRYYDEQHPPLSSGPLVLSDIVLGAASQRLSWRDGELVLPLAPLQGFARSEAVGLYVQVFSSAARPDGVAVDVTIAEPATKTRQRKVALTIGLRRELAAGLTEIQQELDISRLEAGTYELEITVWHASSGASDRRSARLIIR